MGAAQTLGVPRPKRRGAEMEKKCPLSGKTGGFLFLSVLEVKTDSSNPTRRSILACCRLIFYSEKLCREKPEGRYCLLETQAVTGIYIAEQSW